MNFHTLNIPKSAKRSKKIIATSRIISKCNQKCTFLNDHLYTYLDYHLYFFSKLFPNLERAKIIKYNLLIQISVSDSGSVFFILFGKLEEGILF